MKYLSYFLFSVSGIVILAFCAGCNSSEVSDSVVAGSTVVAVAPVYSVAVGAYGSDVAQQGSSIAAGAPKQWYSEKLTMAELWQKSALHGHKFHAPWKYMGTKNGEHYLALYPFLGFRELYRIDVSEYEIEDPFELTSNAYKWREIDEFSYQGVMQNLVIEPQVFGEELGFGEGVGVIRLAPMVEPGVTVENQFMMEVPILQE